MTNFFWEITIGLLGGLVGSICIWHLLDSFLGRKRKVLRKLKKEIAEQKEIHKAELMTQFNALRDDLRAFVGSTREMVDVQMLALLSTMKEEWTINKRMKFEQYVATFLQIPQPMETAEHLPDVKKMMPEKARSRRQRLKEKLAQEVRSDTQNVS